MNPLMSVARHGEVHGDPTAWAWEPSIVVGVALFVALYLYGIGPGRRPGRPAPPRWQIVSFLLGNVALLLALISPLEVLSDEYLFSAHMVQHLLMTMIAVPLWLLGTPEWLLISRLRQSKALLSVGRFITSPAPAFLLFNFTFAFWHWPALYDAALADQRLHIVEHLTFLATAVINWWPVLSPWKEIPRTSHPIQLLYLALNCQPNVVLGAAFVFARETFYQSYLDAPRLFGLTALADQQLGGLIMWIPGNGVYLLVLSIVFLRWFYRQQPQRDILT